MWSALNLAALLYVCMHFVYFITDGGVHVVMSFPIANFIPCIQVCREMKYMKACENASIF